MRGGTRPARTTPQARVAAPGEMGAVADVIRLANPHREARISTFLATGARWHAAMPIVCEESGQIVSCACVFHRCVWTRRGQASFGGIGALSTLPEARNRGYATRVMEACEEHLRKRGCSTALLFCTIVDFYMRRGWSAVPEDWVEFALPERAGARRAPPYCLSQVDAAGIPAAIRELCDRAGEATGSALVRSEGVWDEYGRWPREDPDLFWAASADDRPVAYVRGRRSGGRLELLEATCLEGHEVALPVLLDQQREVLAGRNHVPFHAFLATEHPLTGLLNDAGVDLAWRTSAVDTGTMMIKDLRDAAPAGRPRPETAPTRGSLVTDDFDDGLPWRPRTWWGVDRF